MAYQGSAMNTVSPSRSQSNYPSNSHSNLALNPDQLQQAGSASSFGRPASAQHSNFYPNSTQSQSSAVALHPSQQQSGQWSQSVVNINDQQTPAHHGVPQGPGQQGAAAAAAGGGGYPNQQQAWQQQHAAQQQQQQQGIFGGLFGGTQQQQQGQWMTNPQTGQQVWVPGNQGMMCCNDQNGMCATCLPVKPTDHFVETDPHKMSSCQMMWQQCDATTWCVFFWLILSIVGMGTAIGIVNIDNLVAVYGVTTSAELDIALYNDIKPSENFLGIPQSYERCTQQCTQRNGTVYHDEWPTAVNATTTTVVGGATTVTEHTGVRPTKGGCAFSTSSSSMSGLHGGKLCDSDSLSATAMLMNLSRWNNFRGTLYFIAFMGCLMLFILIIIVNKHQQFVHPNHFPAAGAAGGGTQSASASPNNKDSPARGGGGAAGGNVTNQMNTSMGNMYGASPPWQFYATPFYYMFRFAWGVVSPIIFFWVCTEMYQYWWFEQIYLGQTTGRLNEFWRCYDKKFVGTVVMVTIFLCWPLMQLILSIGVFVGLGLPWMCIKNLAYPQLANYQHDPSLFKEDEESCCVSTEMFFGAWRQLGRLGFSEGIWNMMTETATPWTNCCEGMGFVSSTAPNFGQPHQPQQPPPPTPAPPNITNQQQQQNQQAQQQQQNVSRQDSQLPPNFTQSLRDVSAPPPASASEDPSSRSARQGSQVSGLGASSSNIGATGSGVGPGRSGEFTPSSSQQQAQAGHVRATSAMSNFSASASNMGESRWGDEKASSVDNFSPSGTSSVVALGGDGKKKDKKEKPEKAKKEKTHKSSKEKREKREKSGGSSSGNVL